MSKFSLGNSQLKSRVRSKHFEKLCFPRTVKVVVIVGVAGGAVCQRIPLSSYMPKEPDILRGPNFFPGGWGVNFSSP